MKLKEQIVEALVEAKGSMHVDEIAAAIVARYPNTPIPQDDLSRKVAQTLAIEVKKGRGKSVFSKPKNERGGFRKGYYRLKSTGKSPSRAFKVPEPPRVSSQFTGKAGEYAVMSELLFFGFNASAMTVDDGIDVIASKDDSYFHIQVKTSNAGASGKYSFKITKRAFDSKDASGTFYVLVMRIQEDSRNVCEHLVIPSGEIRRLIATGVVKDGGSLSITIERERGKRFTLNGAQDVTWALNRFDTIK